jgi:hypothetical protein
MPSGVDGPFGRCRGSPVRDGRPYLNRTTHPCLRHAGCYGDRGLEVLGCALIPMSPRLIEFEASHRNEIKNVA